MKHSIKFLKAITQAAFLVSVIFQQWCLSWMRLPVFNKIHELYTEKSYELLPIYTKDVIVLYAICFYVLYFFGFYAIYLCVLAVFKNKAITRKNIRIVNYGTGTFLSLQLLLHYLIL
jgi:hypothetical protein